MRYTGELESLVQETTECNMLSGKMVKYKNIYRFLKFTYTAQ